MMIVSQSTSQKELTIILRKILNICRNIQDDDLVTTIGLETELLATRSLSEAVLLKPVKTRGTGEWKTPCFQGFLKICVKRSPQKEGWNIGYLKFHEMSMSMSYFTPITYCYSKQ